MNVGDRVKITNPNSVFQGYTGIVTEDLHKSIEDPKDRGYLKYNVQIQLPDPFAFREDELEKI